MKKIKKIIKYINDIKTKYNLFLMGASSSYYIIVALFSALVLIFQFYNVFSNDLKDFLISKLIEIINPLYHNLFDGLVPIFEFNSFSIIIFFNLIWSSSRIINNLNTMSDMIYEQHKNRKGFINRISSFLMLLMLTFIAIFEIAVIVFFHKLLYQFIKIPFLIELLEFIVEFVILFFTLLIIYMYAPPIKMNIKNTYLGAGITSVLIYLTTIILLFVIDYYQKISETYNILTILSLFFLWIFIINTIVSLGLIINYKYGKYIQNKK